MARKVDREALRQQISELQIDKELKHQLLEVINEKRYGLVWEDSTEEALDRMQEELPVFTEDASKRLDSAPVGSPNHVIIEGDNLNALAALSYTHAGKIDVIYIDPPYNTGNKDFVYNDSFVDKEDGYRHSKWLSFMNRRLNIAKELLSEKGVILMSIDENEMVNLRLLCCELFSEKNLIACMPRITKASGKTTDKIANNHDYLLVFAKNKDAVEINGLPHNDSGFKYEDEYKCKRGTYKLNQTLDYDSLQYSTSLDYPIEIQGHVLYPGSSYDNYLERKRGNHKRADWAWRWSKDLFQFGLENGFIVLKKSKNGYRIYTKTYQNAKIVKEGNTYKIECSERVKTLESLALTDNMYSNDNAKKELGQIFESLPFDYPKPTSLIRTFLQIIPANTILDFFAGSGTTLHATMQLNAEDGGHRKCILVTNNENNICENVTYERNKRVIQGYTTPKGGQVAGLADNNLRYYRTAFVPREHSNRNRRNLMSSLVDVLCIKNDIYKEEETFGGERFKPSVLRYFNDEAGQMLIVLDERVVSAIVPMIADVATKDNPLKVYVYSDGAYAYEDEFREVMPVVDLCAMPDAYLQALQISDALPEQRYSEETMAEFNAGNAIATQDKEAVAAALSDTYDYVNE